MVNHLKGEITLGTYLLTKENQARFVVLDADDEENFGKILELLKEIPSYMETSRRGGHLWMFLDKSVTGEEAKLFGLGVLNHYGINAESFPKQGESK